MTAIASDSLLFAVLPDYPELGESIAYQLSGLLVVLVALGGIWILLEISGAVFRRNAGGKRTTPSAPKPAAEAPITEIPQAGAEVSPLTCALITATVHAASQGRARILSVSSPEPEALHAIIAAAVHTVFEGRARVVSVNPVHSDPSWAREGRRDIFSSHRIR